MQTCLKKSLLAKRKALFLFFFFWIYCMSAPLLSLTFLERTNVGHLINAVYDRKLAKSKFIAILLQK